MKPSLNIVAVVLFACGTAGAAMAQERVTPAESRGGKPLVAAWENMPAQLRGMKFPNWPLPDDLDRWQRTDRDQTRQTLLECLGELPPRPQPLEVKTLAREDRGDYVLERFEFHNGIDALVPGILLLPKNVAGRAPAVIGLHGHGGSSETICTDVDNPQCVGPDLARRGFVVAAIDTYFCGARARKPQKEKNWPVRYRHADEGTLFRIYLWQGRTLWGMMQRDQQCLIDYLLARKEVDAKRIGVTGMSMGGTGSWWLAAVDDRIAAVVGVAGFTRYEQLIAHNNAPLHGVYYYVPGILKHFDTEAIYALVAPRPMLMLSGDQDGGLPLDGIEILERKVGRVYRLHKQSAAFHSVVYKDTGHEYLPEMRARMIDWFEKRLPANQ